MAEKISLSTIANGAAVEKFNAELAKIMENIIDPNTDPLKSRAINLVVKFKPDEDRGMTKVTFDVKTTLANQKQVETRLAIYEDEQGKPLVHEMIKGQIAGQAPLVTKVDEETGEILEDQEPQGRKIQLVR